MNDKKTIMICTENLGLGGVETVVCNQANYLQSQGYNVIVLAKDGVNREKLQQENIKVIDFDFQLENEYNLANAKKLIEIAKEHNVSQIHVHKLPCITTVLPAYLLSRIPYIAYVHVSIDGIYEWFMKNYPIYENAFKKFYENAEKIVSITPSAKQRNQKLFGTPDEKFVICYNSINFEEYKTETETKELKHFLILSRFVGEKMQSIKNGIDLYVKYKEKNSDIDLEIVGGGHGKEELEEYIKKYPDSNITISDGTSKVKELIEQKDVIIGVDRCILEAVALKRLAIVSGYDSLKQIVTEENIDKLSSENFTGHNLETKTIEEIANELSATDISKTVQYNYEYIKGKLSIKQNNYILSETKHVEPQEKYDIILELERENKELLKKQLIKQKEILDKQANELIQNATQIEGQAKQIKELSNELENKQKELETIYNSRYWKIRKIFLG